MLINKLDRYRSIYERLARAHPETMEAVIEFIEITELEELNSLRRGNEDSIHSNRIMLAFIDYLKEHLLKATEKLDNIEMVIENSNKATITERILKKLRGGRSQEEKLRVLRQMKFSLETVGSREGGK